MEWITSSKLFKGSKYQDRILAAIQDPINKPLVQQLTSYVDPKYIEPEDDIDNKNSEIDETEEKPKFADKAKGGPRSSGGGSSFSGPSMSNGHFDMPEDAEFDESEDSEELSTDAEVEDSESPETEEVEEATQLGSNKIQASTYVTMEDVSQAIKYIPGTLNLTEGTCGVTYVTIKGTPASEVWIYYNSDVDINKVLTGLNTTLLESGYTFLSFNRVSRDENAVVFTINWATTYYQQPTFEAKENES